MAEALLEEQLDLPQANVLSLLQEQVDQETHPLEMLEFLLAALLAAVVVAEDLQQLQQTMLEVVEE